MYGRGGCVYARSGKHDAVSPIKLMRDLMEVHAYQYYSQEDAHETLRYVMCVSCDN